MTCLPKNVTNLTFNCIFKCCEIALNQPDKTVKLRTTTNQTDYDNPQSRQTADCNTSALELCLL